jgi:ubiquinol-cytochrome c reductase cytochrome c subunit
MPRLVPVLRNALCAWAAGCALAGTAVRAADSAGDAQRGYAMYLRVGCYECHGTRGAGGGIAGPALVSRRLPIQVFTAQLRNPLREMPPYAAGLLGDEDVGDLYAYVLSLPEGRKASQIPELNH